MFNSQDIPRTVPPSNYDAFSKTGVLWRRQHSNKFLSLVQQCAGVYVDTVQSCSPLALYRWVKPSVCPCKLTFVVWPSHSSTDQALGGWHCRHFFCCRGAEKLKIWDDFLLIMRNRETARGSYEYKMIIERSIKRELKWHLLRHTLANIMSTVSTSDS